MNLLTRNIQYSTYVQRNFQKSRQKAFKLLQHEQNRMAKYSKFYAMPMKPSKNIVSIDSILYLIKILEVRKIAVIITTS